MKPLQKQISKIEKLKSEIDDKKNNQDMWVDKIAGKDFYHLKALKDTIEENKAFLLGAEGENMVIDELSKLPETYSVINDYQRGFYRPIYDSRNDDRIMSIQIDHIVIGPTGIFIIETKNWSKETMHNSDIFSPVKQLRRDGFALFVLLNESMGLGGRLDIFNKSWGEKKISPREILLFIHHKPKEEFQFVKILELHELVSYLTYGKIVFDNEEIGSLLKYFEVELNNTTIHTTPIT